MGSEVGRKILTPYCVMNHLFMGKFYASKSLQFRGRIKASLSRGRCLSALGIVYASRSHVKISLSRGELTLGVLCSVKSPKELLQAVATCGETPVGLVNNLAVR